MAINDVSLFMGADLIIGRTGRATVTKTIDPEDSFDILHADAFSDLRVIPGRDGASDVTVRGMEEMAQREGLAARLAHHARHGGTIKIRGRNYTLTEVSGDTLTVVTRDGTFRRFDLDKISLQFGAVEPPYVANPTPSIRVMVGNTGGADELHLRAELDAAGGDVLHQIIITDAAEQKNIEAELATFLAVSNDTGVELSDMSLSLRLNEPAPSRSPKRRGAVPWSADGAAYALESVEEEIIEPIRETAAAGVLTMPVAVNVTIRPGETRTLNIAAAIAGEPNEDIERVPVTLRQDLTLGFLVLPGKPGSEVTAKDSPRASYTMSGTPAPQPAGTYEIYEGGDLAGSRFKFEYTEEETEVTIQGSTMRSIEAKWTVRTVAIEEGKWARAVAVDMPVPRGTEHQERVNTFSMAGSIELSSKSEHAREVDVEMGVGSFDQGNSGIRASVNGAPVEARYDKEEDKLVIPGVVLPAGGAATVAFSFDGKKTERRRVDISSGRGSPE